MPYNFDDLNGSDKISLIYSAYYGRAPDPLGFLFWSDFYSSETASGRGSNNTVLEITDFFLDQTETRNNYSFFTDPGTATLSDIGAFLDQVYFNLFNRSPDIDGKAFWAGQIQTRLSEGLGFSDLLVQIIEGAQGTDITALNNKLSVANYYVSNIGENFDLAQATRVALDTTSAPDSAQMVIAQIDLFLQEGARFFDAGRSSTHFLVSDLSGGEISLIDMESGTAQIVAYTGLQTITDIAVLPSGEVLLVDFGALYRYSFASNTTERLATFPTSINALEADENGTLYAAGPNSTELYRIDPTTFTPVQIGTLPAGSAGDISVSRDSLYITLTNDDLVFVDASNTSSFEIVQEDRDISTFWGIVQLEDQLFAGADRQIINITDADNYEVVLNVSQPGFSTISGSSYIYDSLVDYLMT